MTASLRPELLSWVEQSTASDVTSAEPIGAGSSRRTWGVDLADGGQLVVREDTGGGPTSNTPLDLSREATVYRALDASGLPVPRLLGVAPDGTALLLERARGAADLSALPVDERNAVMADYLRCLGRLHTLDVNGLDLGALPVPSTGPDHALLDVALWQSIHDSIEETWRTAAGTFALAWLQERPPTEATRTSLCHGDAGALNFLHDNSRVTALLDWEFTHVGDPLDDLAWVSARNFLLRTRLDTSAAFDAWRDVTGCDLDAARLEYYRVLVLVRMLVSCDATVRWSRGAETAETRTQVLLRPLLAQCLGPALRRAGCTDPALTALERDAAEAWANSPLLGAFGEEPELEDFGVLR
ncbi:MAG: phosphotransferase family protein [Actinobacteria bacterium]|nr:phosphotransferase family protein [Actinomycetota bacterium]